MHEAGTQEDEAIRLLDEAEWLLEASSTFDEERAALAKQIRAFRAASAVSGSPDTKEDER